MELLEIGRIVRPHGLTGGMKVLSYLESDGVLQNLKEVSIGRNEREVETFPLQAVQTGKGYYILKLKGIEGRDSVEGLVGSSVWMPLTNMETLPEGEYYWSEIVGLNVITEDGKDLGRIESVFPTGSNDVYVCKGGGKEILLPAISDVVRKIDKKSKVMVVRLLEGLAES